MNKSKVITIACLFISAIALLIVAGLLLFGNHLGFIGFQGVEILSGSYQQQGTYIVPGGKVQSIEVSWTAGYVSLTPYDGDDIVMTEYCQRELKSQEMLYFEEKNNTLTIRFTQQANTSHMPPKGLEILVPTALADQINNLSVDSTSADITLENISSNSYGVSTVSGMINIDGAIAKTMTLSSTSGDFLANNIQTENCQINTVSGYMHGQSVSGNSFSFESTSGGLDLTETDIQKISTSTISGYATLSGTIESLNASSTSGDVWISGQICPEKVTISTVSGCVDLSIPKTEGLSVKFDTVSGSCNYDFDIVTSVSEPRFKISTTSGDLTISNNQ